MQTPWACCFCRAGSPISTRRTGQGAGLSVAEASAAMEAKPGFVCALCGTAHEGCPTDRGYTLPDDVWALPESEHETRATFTTDLCEMDGRYFIRGILLIPFVQRDADFAWGVWAELERSAFERYVEIYDADASDEPPVGATLANAIPGFPDAARERVLVIWGQSGDRPEFVLEKHSESSLAEAQRCGIDEQRYHELLIAAGAI